MRISKVDLSCDNDWYYKMDEEGDVEVSIRVETEVKIERIFKEFEWAQRLLQEAYEREKERVRKASGKAKGKS